jgi:hypothetical protein
MAAGGDLQHLKQHLPVSWTKEPVMLGGGTQADLISILSVMPWFQAETVSNLC